MPQAQHALTAIKAYMSDLRMEIADTEATNFREHLKQREVFLKKLLQELPDRQV